MNMDLRHWISTIGGIIVTILGGWDIWLTSLLILMAIDIISGLARAVFLRTGKNKTRRNTSKQVLFGIVKKIFILCLVAMGTALDGIMTPGQTFLRCAITGYYIATEGLNVLENMGACGVPLPKILYSVLEALRKDSDRDK